MMRYTEALDRKVYLREDTSDEQTWIDTFERLYHVPPAKINPETVLDLGANIGLTAAHYQTMWPMAKILAVEMDRDNGLVCQQNFVGPLIFAAVGVKSGKGSYVKRSWNWEASYSLTRPGEKQVQIIALSEILGSMGQVDFCKMDIEGTEWDLFAQPDDWADGISSLLVELHGDDPSADILMRGISLLEVAGFKVEPHTIHPQSLWAVR